MAGIRSEVAENRAPEKKLLKPEEELDEYDAVADYMEVQQRRRCSQPTLLPRFAVRREHARTGTRTFFAQQAAREFRVDVPSGDAWQSLSAD